jgi:ribosomal protein S18 acetylase RimI-like enzyme
MKIRPVTAKSVRRDICNRILRSLPDWFGIEEAINDYVRNAADLPMFCCFDGHTAAAFLSVKIHYKYSAEVYVMGVLPQYHRRGIGRELLKSAEVFLKKKGVRFLQVKTLSPSRSCREYEITRKFYLAQGFVPLEEFKTLWGAANPCLLMIKGI